MTKRLVKTLIISSIAWSSISLSSLASGEDKYRYKEGDCITPTNENWSWYGKVVRVLGAFRRLDDVPSYDIYLLQFNPKNAAPWDKPITGQFFLEDVEKNTQKIPSWMCESDQSG